MYLLPTFDVRDILLEGRASARNAYFSPADKEADYTLFDRALALSIAIQDILIGDPMTGIIPFLVEDNCLVRVQ